jgi:hypothetical protein
MAALSGFSGITARQNLIFFPVSAAVVSLFAQQLTRH